MRAREPTPIVIPAKAGTQCAVHTLSLWTSGRERLFWRAAARLLDSRVRGNDKVG
jgi:hypothetical protein